MVQQHKEMGTAIALIMIMIINKLIKKQHLVLQPYR